MKKSINLMKKTYLSFCFFFSFAKCQIRGLLSGLSLIMALHTVCSDEMSRLFFQYH